MGNETSEAGARINVKEKRAVVPAMMLYFVVLVRGMAGARNTDKPRRIGCGINRFSGLK